MTGAIWNVVNGESSTLGRFDHSPNRRATTGLCATMAVRRVVFSRRADRFSVGLKRRHGILGRGRPGRGVGLPYLRFGGRWVLPVSSL